MALKNDTNIIITQEESRPIGQGKPAGSFFGNLK